MYGQKQIFSCMLIVLLVSILNFYKSILKRDKEQRLYMEQEKQRRHEEQLIEKENSIEMEIRLRIDVNRKHEVFQAKWLEYDDKCVDLHALIFRPGDYTGNNDRNARDHIIDNNYTEDYIENVSQKNHTVEKNSIRSAVACGGSEEQCTENNILSAKQIPSTTAGNSKGKGKIMERISESSSSIIYVAVLVLLISLGKAVFDLRKQFQEVCIITFLKVFFLCIFKYL